MMSSHLPALIIVVPLLGAFVIAASGWVNRRYCYPLSLFVLSACLLTALGLLRQVLQNGEILYRMAGWDPPVGISLNIDHLNALVLVVITAVALVNVIATRRSVADEFADRLGPFYALYVLFVTGVCGIVATGDAFNLYVLLEIASLSGYALIGMGHDRAAHASLNYIFMGTIGASFYLLGIGYLYLVTGSLNMKDIAELLPLLYGSKVVLFALIICIAGLFVKMALFPLHAWLPNAYAFAPPASASLIAPLTTKVMIYVMIRIVLYVFTPDFAFDRLQLDEAIVWLAVAAIVMGSLFALAQRSLKRVLAYIIVAEVGYMVGGLWLGNRAAITGAVLHIVNDAVMTLCVFLAAGCILYRTGHDRFENFRGLFRTMPFSMAGLAAGALAIIGVPPTCGFFSKWYLISGGIAADHYGFVAALIFSSLVNIVLFFRIFEFAYYESPDESHNPHGAHSAAKLNEAPLEMVGALLFVAGMLVVLGLWTGEIVTRIIHFAIPAGIV
jgi:multicomponent Na+:H+ antiporter subunit D